MRIVPNPVLPLSTEGRNKMFGRFAYKATPTRDNPERIQVTDKEWLKNLVKIDLPASIAMVEGADVAWFHTLVVPKFLELVAAWDSAGVSLDILSWGGSYSPRFIRGRPGVLSSHAWGSALDLNVAWNQLGKTPAALGQKGSVLRLVPIAERLGWAWGGRFSRPDGMHFELAKY